MKVEYAQYNDLLKDIIHDIITYLLKENGGSLQATETYELVSAFLYQNLRDYNPTLYKLIVGMLFADTYRILSYKKEYFEASGEELTLLKWITSVDSMSELISYIDMNNINLSDLVEYGLSFGRKTLYQQYLCYDASDMGFAIKFNPFMLLEYADIIKPYSLEKLLEEFSAGVEETESDIKITKSAEAIVFYLKEKILVYSQCNEEELKRVMTEIIRHYYKLTKAYQLKRPEDILDFDEFLMKLIDEHEINDVIDCIIHDEQLLMYIVRLYLESKSFGCDFSDEEIESYFQNNTSDKIKKKLEGKG